MAADDRIRAATASVEASGATGGTVARRDCLAASRATVCQRAAPLTDFSSDQRATHREAAHGTSASTPASVARSTASSLRSPLGSACTRVTRTAGSGMRSAAVDEELDAAAADGGHGGCRDPAGAIAERQQFPDADAPDDGGVPPLGAGQHERTGRGHRVHQEERSTGQARAAHRPTNESRMREKRPP